MARHNVYREGKVHVCKVMCSTCIFHPDNRMKLEPGRVDGMVADALRKNSTIVCHDTLDGDNAACRGFYEFHNPPILQVAQRLGFLKEV